jgi:hypothetical protein
MPNIIWKTESDDQFRLFKFRNNGIKYDEDYFTFYISGMIQMMNSEASFVFADFCFYDNYWELLEEDKIDSIYRKVIIENINKLTFTECYNLLYTLELFWIWTDEANEVFTIEKLNHINDLITMKHKLYYAIRDHIVFHNHDHIENIPEDPYYIRKCSDKKEVDIASSRVCYRICLKENTNIIARYIYEKIWRAKNTNKDLLVNSTNKYILDHIRSPAYNKKDLEFVIYEYGIQNAIEEFRDCYDGDPKDITFNIAYYILCDSFEYIAYTRSSL